MNEYMLLCSEVLWLDASKSYMSVYVVSKHIMFRVTLYDTTFFLDFVILDHILLYFICNLNSLVFNIANIAKY